MELSFGDTTCSKTSGDGSSSFGSVEILLDGVCHTVQVPDGEGGVRNAYYKANTILPEPLCFASYEEVDTCGGTVKDQADATFGFLYGDKPVGRYNNACTRVSDDKSYKIVCVG